MTNVAMLIDWENIKACSTNHLATPPDIVTLKKIARKYGTLTVARAYAHWTDPSGWHAGDVERLSDQGIDPVFVWTRKEQVNPGGQDNATNYVKDMVDIRLACDGMELLAAHPEIGCYVVVSGDGALETLLAKLSAHGKKVVRVATRHGLSSNTRVLNEERVIYDDWVQGLKFSGAAKSEAIELFVQAVSELRKEGLPSDLKSTKDRILQQMPEFNEESYGISTFRHLAYLAEVQGMVRIDARKEPAEAYLADEPTASDGTCLPTGEQWTAFIQALDVSEVYIAQGMAAALANVSWDGGEPFDLAKLAVASNVMTQLSTRYVVKDRDSGAARPIYSGQFRLNPFHPRVQIACANK